MRILIALTFSLAVAGPVCAEPMLMIPESQARQLLQGVHTMKQENTVLRQAQAERDALIAKQAELAAKQEEVIAKLEEVGQLRDEHLAVLDQARRDAERLGWWKAAGGAALTAAGFVVFSVLK